VMSIVDAQPQRPKGPHGASAAGLKAALRAHAGALRADRRYDGLLRALPIAEVRRALRGAVDVTRDRRPLVPVLDLDENWLSEAARRHDVPVSPSLVA